MATLQEERVNFNSKPIIYHSSANLSTDTGYPVDSAANSLKGVPLFCLILIKEGIASQPSLSRFWGRITPEIISLFQNLNQALGDKARLERNATELLMIWITPIDTFGNREDTDCNAHYGTNGYHPLVAFDGLTNDFLKAELRFGNVYTSKEVKKFLELLQEHDTKMLPCTDILVRGDSGFATLEVYDVCEVY